MLIMSEGLSYQLGMEGHIYMGPRTKETQTKDVDYTKKQCLYLLQPDSERGGGDTETPFLKQIAVKPHSKKSIKTYIFRHLMFQRDNCLNFRLRQSAMVSYSYYHTETYVPQRGKYAEYYKRS